MIVFQCSLSDVVDTEHCPSDVLEYSLIIEKDAATYPGLDSFLHQWMANSPKGGARKSNGPLRDAVPLHGC